MKIIPVIILLIATGCNRPNPDIYGRWRVVSVVDLSGCTLPAAHPLQPRYTFCPSNDYYVIQSNNTLTLESAVFPRVTVPCRINADTLQTPSLIGEDGSTSDDLNAISEYYISDDGQFMFLRELFDTKTLWKEKDAEQSGPAYPPQGVGSANP